MTTRKEPGLGSALRRTKLKFCAAGLVIATGMASGGAMVARNDWHMPFLPKPQKTYRVLYQTNQTDIVQNARDAVISPSLGDGAGRGRPLVLAFHDIKPGAGGLYAMTPEAFASQMALLDQLGFKTITLADFEQYLHGGAALPARSVLLTFDDGGSGLWEYADPILAQYRFHASVFVITGSLADRAPSYYLTWDELRQMAWSGRWDVGAHADKGHHEVPTDARGGKGQFFASREWLPQARRLETIDEFRSRIEHDLDSIGPALAAHGLPRPRIFASPMSAGAAGTTDPQVLAVLQQALTARYAADFVNDDLAGAVVPGSSRRIGRIEVTSATGVRDVFERIQRSVDRPLTPGPLLADPGMWVGDDGKALTAEAFVDGGLRLNVTPGTQSRAYFAPAGTHGWRDYSVDAQVEGLDDPQSLAGVTLFSGSGSEYRVTLSGFWATVRTGPAAGPWAVVAQRSIPFGASHHVLAGSANGLFQVTVDGLPVFSIPIADPAASGGVDVYATRGDASQPPPTFRSITIGH